VTKLVATHIMRVPFENISKIYYKKHFGLNTLPSLQQFLEGVEKNNFGGTCYTSNFYFNLLLSSLGYKVKLCGADMTNPDVHIVSIVDLDNQEYLIDVGYAAPFLMPLSRDLKEDFVITLGRDRYILKPQDKRGYSQLVLFRDGVLKHGYVAKPIPRKIEYFDEVIANSYKTSSTFFNALLLARFFPERSIIIHNLSLIESQGIESRIQSLKNSKELVDAIEEYFNIPRNIITDTLSEIKEFKDA
jgi:arylamine N-acetyltransferase